MKISFTLTEADYRTVVQAYFESGRAGKVAKLLTWLGGLYLIVSASRDTYRGDMIGGPIFVLVGLGLICWLPLFYRFWAPRDFRRTPHLADEMSFAFHEDQIIMTTSKVNSTVRWDIFTSWRETKDFFLLLQGPRCYAPLPKRAFPEGEVDAFRELVRRKLDPKAK